MAKSYYFLRHVCPSVRMKQLDSHWRDFHDICHLGIFRKKKSRGNLFFHSKQTVINDTLPEDRYTFFLSYLAQFFLE